MIKYQLCHLEERGHLGNPNQLEWKDFDVYLKYKYTWLACLPEPPALPLVVGPAENEYYFRKELIRTIFSKII